jgi:hypothetical protein
MYTASAYRESMAFEVMGQLSDRNLSSFPPSERHLAAGQHFAKLIGRTRAGQIRLLPKLAQLLNIPSQPVDPEQWVRDGLRDLADRTDVIEGINRHLEHKGVETNVCDPYTATDIAVEIRQDLAAGVEGGVPLR